MGFGFFNFFGQSGNDLKKIADDAEIGHPKDRRFRILINCDDVL